MTASPETEEALFTIIEQLENVTKCVESTSEKISRLEKQSSEPPISRATMKAIFIEALREQASEKQITEQRLSEIFESRLQDAQSQISQRNASGHAETKRKLVDLNNAIVGLRNSVSAREEKRQKPSLLNRLYAVVSGYDFAIHASIKKTLFVSFVIAASFTGVWTLNKLLNG